MTNFYLTNFTKNTVLTAIIILPSLLSSQHSRGSAIDFEFKQSISDSGIDTLLTTPTRINNLAVLGKIWGFLKYYHPAVARGEYNWDNELFRILPRMLEVESPAERDQALIGWIDALGEVVPGKNNIKKKGNIKLLPDLGWIDSSGFSPALVSRLTRIRNVVREGEHYYVELMRSEENTSELQSLMRISYAVSSRI